MYRYYAQYKNTQKLEKYVCDNTCIVTCISQQMLVHHQQTSNILNRLLSNVFSSWLCTISLLSLEVLYVAVEMQEASDA